MQGEEDFLTETQESKRQLCVCFKKTTLCGNKRLRILGQIRDRAWECPRKVREKLKVEINDLERDKSEASECNKEGFDPGLSKDEWWCRDQHQRADGCSDGGNRRVVPLPSIN